LVIIDKVILGIDPGTTIMGYGLIQIKNNKPYLITLGVMDLRKYSDHYLKIKRIYDRTFSLMKEYKPDELAIEAPFYGKNVQSMLKLGRAQGAAISAALNYSIPIFEYAPRKIKMSITGNGAASKEQVAGILKAVLKINDLPEFLDATDGVAAALCHFYQGNNIISQKKSSKWGDFIKNNPDRVCK
jgi:crossover junction endodeoxyribonuclease RuvC